MSHPFRWFARATCAFVMAVAAGPAATAATLVWQNAAGGAAGVAGNWNPAQVPVELDILRWDLANTYDVNFFASVDSVASHLIYGGDVTFDFNAPHGLRTGFHVAQVGAQVATARIVGGTLRLGWVSSVGAGTGAFGTLRIAGGTADVFQNTVSGAVLDVGGNAATAGTGEVVVINGGVLELAKDLNLGRNPGSLGTLRVKGAGATGSGLRRSHFFADAADGDGVMGLNGGHGVLEVLDGGLFRVGRALRVAEAAGDIGDITVGGENAIDSSEVRVKGDLFLGANLIAGAAGGTATLTLDSLGVVIVDDSTVVGDPDGGSASLTIANHTRFHTKHLIQRSGTLHFTGGYLQVNGGTLSTANGRLTIPGNATGEVAPTLWMINGSSATFAGKSTAHSVALGTTGQAAMYLMGGSSVTANGGQVELGDPAGSDGRIFVLDGSLSSDQAAVIGGAGSGLLHVSAGDVLVDGMNLGSSAAGSGSLFALSAATTVTSSGPLNVGGTTLAAGGAGSVVVSNGARLDLAAPVLAGTVWENGDLRVNASELNLTGLLTVRGGFEVESGASVSGGVIALRGTGSITGDGLLRSGILAGTDSTVAIAATGTLQIGTTDSNGNVLHRGTLDVGAYSVSVSDPDSSILGVVTMAGGELHLSSGGGVIEAGKRLTGDGAIYGPLVVRGYLTSVGPNPMDVHGTIIGVGQGVGGKKLHFFPGSRFEGSGAINTEVEADSGSVIRATGFLEVGKPTFGNPPILRGRLETGGNLVVLRWTSDVNFEGQLALEDGSVSVSFANPIHLLAGSRVDGSGKFSCPVLAAGTIAPGNSAGRLRFLSFTSAGGTIEMELGNHATSEHDTLVVDDLAILGGTLELRRLPSFAAAAGDSFQIVEADSVSGTFAVVTLDGLPISGLAEVHYAANGVWVVILDGTVAVGDDPLPSARALAFAAWGSPGPRPGVELALPAASAVALRVFDVTGREVAAIHEEILAAGRHRIELPGVPGAGVYFAQVLVGEGGTVVRRTVRIIRLR